MSIILSTKSIVGKKQRGQDVKLGISTSALSNSGTAQWSLPHRLGTLDSLNFQSLFSQGIFDLIDVCAGVQRGLTFVVAFVSTAYPQSTYQEYLGHVPVTSHGLRTGNLSISTIHNICKNPNTILVQSRRISTSQHFLPTTTSFKLHQNNGPP
jgi:hypothetical protein